MINDLNARKAYMWKYVDTTISEVKDKVQCLEQLGMETHVELFPSY